MIIWSMIHECEASIFKNLQIYNLVYRRLWKQKSRLNYGVILEIARVYMIYAFATDRRCLREADDAGRFTSTAEF